MSVVVVGFVINVVVVWVAVVVEVVIDIDGGGYGWICDWCGGGGYRGRSWVCDVVCLRRGAAVWVKGRRHERSES